jgi:hypothetical protein
LVVLVAIQIAAKKFQPFFGGSGLRYSFDIKSDGAGYEVGVDTQTGTVPRGY